MCLSNAKAVYKPYNRSTAHDLGNPNAISDNPKHLKGNRAASRKQLLKLLPELSSLHLVFKLHPPWLMKDSDRPRPPEF